MVRRRVAEVAALAVAVAAVVAVSSLTQHQGHKPPAPVTHRYHVTVSPPSPGSAKGLIASGLVNGRHWRVIGQREAPGACFGALAPETYCYTGAPDLPYRTGDPASLTGGIGGRPLAIFGTVRSDVAYLRVGLTNGQILTLQPVPVFGHRHARYVAFAVPSATVVTKIWAYSSYSELAYAVPFTRGGLVWTVRWLPAGALPRPVPATYPIRAEGVGGRIWSSHVYVGPWGVCIEGPGANGMCYGQRLGQLPEGRAAFLLSVSGAQAGGYAYANWATSAKVSYLMVTLSDGRTARLPTAPAGSVRFAVFTWRVGSRPVRWAAYSATGHELASGNHIH